MDLVLDNNIVIDHIDRREPFYELSRRVCLLGVVGEANTYISVNMLTDIYYLLRKDYGSQGEQDLIENSSSAYRPKMRRRRLLRGGAISRTAWWRGARRRSRPTTSSRAT